MIQTKKILITGAATGVGLATTRILSNSGYHVLATAMPQQDTSELQMLNNVQVFEVDLSDEQSIDALIKTIQNYGSIDAFISNAGIAVPGPVECVPIDQIKLQYQINVFAPIQLVQGLLPQLRETKGRLIFIGAGQGRVSLPFGGPYGSSKSAITSITDALRTEIHDSGIFVSVLEPGAIKTDILHKSKERWEKIVSGLTQEQSQRYQTSIIKTFQTSEKAFLNAMTPDDFALQIKNILENKKPKPRYAIGKEAKVLVFLSMLPAKWRAKLLIRLM